MLVRFLAFCYKFLPLLSNTVWFTKITIDNTKESIISLVIFLNQGIRVCRESRILL